MSTQTALIEETQTALSEIEDTEDLIAEYLSPLDKLRSYEVPINWTIGHVDKAQAQDLAYALDIPTAVGGLYILRDLDTVEKVREFQHIDAGKMHSPWLLPDIEKAVDRTEAAIRNGEHIHVHGDYDADGVTSTAIMVLGLKRLKANFTYHTPHRIFEGYGLRPETVEDAVANGTKLLITVDCGTRDFKAIKTAHKYNLDVIITDHHELQEDGKVPDAFAVINPSRPDSEYPFHGLAGCGVALKFMQALCERFGYSNEYVLNGVAEYVTIGTVADMVPIIDENRIIVSNGLKKLNETKRVGLIELIKISRINKVDTTAIGFSLGPRINAAGRLSDSGIALDLVLETNQENAIRLAKEVEALNVRRQEICRVAVQQAIDLLPEDITNTNIVVLRSPNWHSGIVGLVATQITQALGRPSMIAMDGDHTCKGSCRSIENFHILKAMNYVENRYLKEHGVSAFDKYGGHAMAAGFSIHSDKMIDLYKYINEYAAEQGFKPVRNVNIDMKLSTSSITPQLLDAIDEMSPFGKENEPPVFMSSGLEIVEIKTLKDDIHLKLKLKNPKDPDRILEALWWRNGNEAKHYQIGQLVDLAYTLSKGDFRGTKNISLIVSDMRLSK